MLHALMVSIKLRVRLRHVSRFLAKQVSQPGLGLPEARKRLRDEVTRWGQESGVDPSLLEDVISPVLADLASTDQTSPTPANTLRENLLELTSCVAENFDLHFADGHFATHAYQEFEMQRIEKVATSQDDRSLALDLGCATARVGRVLADRFHFEHVTCVDVSPTMIEQAQKQHGVQGRKMSFRTFDLEQEIPAESSTASLVVMSMGTASEIQNLGGLLGEIERVLKPGGSAILSFYNKESLDNKSAIIPWGLSLAAEIDATNSCLEVCWRGRIYTIFGRAYTVEEIEELIPPQLEALRIDTYPTIGSIIPTEVAHDRNGLTDLGEQVQEIDAALSTSPSRLGHYILIELRKQTGQTLRDGSAQHKE
jgi:SAM-dependent methyltransferase